MKCSECGEEIGEASRIVFGGKCRDCWMKEITEFVKVARGCMRNPRECLVGEPIRKLVQWNQGKSLTEIAKNPPIRDDQTMEYEIDRYAPPYKAQAMELRGKYLRKEISYSDFVLALNKIRSEALHAQSYRV